MASPILRRAPLLGLPKQASLAALSRGTTKPFKTPSPHPRGSAGPCAVAVNARRWYVDKNNTPQATSNVSGSPLSGSPQEKQAKMGAGVGSKQSLDSASVASPVSNPESAGMGAQEEEQPSQEHMKRDPSEPAAKKRSEALKEGQKPLDPADK